MGAEAEVYERRAVNVVDAHALARLVLNQLALQRLVAVLENLERLRLRNLVAPVREVSPGEFAHALLDDGQVFFCESARRDHVVEEAIARVVQGRRANAA